MAGFEKAGAAWRIWTVLRGARPESAGHAILRELSECAGGGIADDYGGEYRETAIPRQHSDSDRRRERIAGGVHGQLTLRRNFAYAGLRPGRRSDGAPVQ